MRSSVLIALVVPLLLTLVPVALWASDCPKVGMYSTYAGTMLPGRASEAWCGLDGTYGPGEEGNAENAMSWDSVGSTLAGEWKLYGMTADPLGAVMIDMNLDGNGTGSITYRTNYDGGEFWLSKDGAWGDGTVDYTGYMTSYVVVATVTYVYGKMVGATSNVTAHGVFDNCPMKDAVVEFVIANAMLVWHPAWGGTPPGNYPPGLCTTTGVELFDVCCVTMNFQPAVPVEELSWGKIKSLYK